MSASKIDCQKKPMIMSYLLARTRLFRCSDKMKFLKRENDIIKQNNHLISIQVNLL
jgi:hypothetical protein